MFSVSSIAGYVRPSIAVQRVAFSSNKIRDPNEPIDMENPYKREQKKCILCEHNITPNYKNVRLLSQFQSRFTGKIYGRHISGLCKKKQDQLEHEMNIAIYLALMPSYHKEPDFYEDPRLFDPENPLRPHPY